MLDTIKSFNHQAYLPKFNHYDIEPILDGIKNSCDWGTVQKVSSLALPLLTTYEITARPTTYVCQAVQVLTDTHQLFLAIFVERNLSLSLFNLIKLSATTITVASLVFDWKFGSLITTSYAFIQSIPPLLDAIVEKDYQRLVDAAGHSLVNLLYLLVFFTGSLEIGLACVLIQILYLAKDSYNDFQDGNYWELASHLIQLGLKTSSAKFQIELIQKRNAFLKFEKFQKLMQGLESVRKVSHIDSEHPLLDIDQAIEDHDVKIGSQSYGSHFFGLGEEHVKGMNLEFRKLEDENYGTKLNFSVNHAEIASLKAGIYELDKMKPQEIKDLFEIFSIPLEDFSIKKRTISFDDAYKPLTGTKSANSKEHYNLDIFEVVFKGFGAIRIASNTKYWFMHSHVQVFIEKGKSLYDLHSVLSFVGLESVLKLSRPQDFKRMEIAHLFRVFFPKLAHELEVTKEFFQLSIEELKQLIIRQAPKMQEIFDKFLDKISFHQIFPGKYRVKINGLKDELKNLGALGLTASIYDKGWNEDNSFERTIGILKAGMISSEVRHRNAMNLAGLSVHADKYTGGSDSVFTQMVTDKTQSYDELFYNSNIRFLFDLEAVETSTYQYIHDCFGFRRRDAISPYISYSNVMGITEFATTIQERVRYFWQPNQSIDFLKYGGQEVMIKDRIPPEWIKGIIVQDAITKDKLISALTQADLVKQDATGLSIFNIPIDRFIHVGNDVVKEHFD